MKSRYPTVLGTPGRRYVEALGEFPPTDLIPQLDELPITWVGPPTAPAHDVGPLYRLGRRAAQDISRNVFSSGNSGERFEAAYAQPLHDLLKELPGDVLTDRAFWRFLSIGPFFAATVWR